MFTRFHIGISVEEVLSIFSNGFALLNKMSTIPIYGKTTLKNLLLQNQELNLGVQHWRLKVNQVDSNDDSRLTFDLSMAMSYLHSHTLVWGKH